MVQKNIGLEWTSIGQNKRDIGKIRRIFQWAEKYKPILNILMSYRTNRCAGRTRIIQFAHVYCAGRTRQSMSHEQEKKNYHVAQRDACSHKAIYLSHDVNV